MRLSAARARPPAARVPPAAMSPRRRAVFELAPFHQQFLPCFEAEDSTAGDLLHCGISKEPLSAVGQTRPSPSTLQRPLPPTADIAPRWLLAAMCHEATYAVQQ